MIRLLPGLLLLPVVSVACSCLPQPPWCGGLGGSSGPVFVGTAVAITALPISADELPFLRSRKIRFQVKESFGGLAPGQSQIDILTGHGGGDCGVDFERGATYLVSASNTKDGSVEVSVCSPTQRVEHAGVRLGILRKLRDGQKAPSLAGRIARRDRSLVSHLNSAPAKPLSKVVVRVKSEERTYETQADADGQFWFYDLPRGKYEFAPDLPEGTRLSWFIDSDQPSLPFELTGSGCQLRYIDVFPSGSIRGRVFDSSGRLLPRASVSIIPAATKALPRRRELYSESQGREDFFKFVHLPPGKYLLVVNPDDKLDAEFPYRRTFYPGVRDRSAATVITLRAGEQFQGADIRLQPQFEPRHLDVMVTWSDGQPVTSMAFIRAKSTSNPQLTSVAMTGRSSNVVDLSLFPQESYTITADTVCQYFDKHGSGPGPTLKSPTVLVRPQDGRTQLTLAFPVASCPVIPGKTLVDER